MKMILGGLAALTIAGGIAAAAPAQADTIRCHTGGGGELWCQDLDTGRSWEQEPGGSYPSPPSGLCTRWGCPPGPG
jgi:hypothetical protein